MRISGALAQALRPLALCSFTFGMFAVAPAASADAAGAQTSREALDIVETVEAEPMTEEFEAPRERRPAVPGASGAGDRPRRDFVRSHRDTEIAVARRALRARPFSNFDLNDDGGITREERLAFPYVDGIAFARIDRDGDGRIDEAEFERFLDPNGEQRRPDEGIERSSGRRQETGTAWRRRRSS